MLGGPAQDLRRAPTGRRPGARRLHRVALDPALDPAVDVVEEDGLRAGPAAPDAPEERRDEEEPETEAADQEEQKPEVLGGQGEAEEVEAPVLATSRNTAG